MDYKEQFNSDEYKINSCELFSFSLSFDSISVAAAPADNPEARKSGPRIEVFQSGRALKAKAIYLYKYQVLLHI